jgi:hypothetical protein
LIEPRDSAHPCQGQITLDDEVAIDCGRSCAAGDLSYQSDGARPRAVITPHSDPAPFGSQTHVCGRDTAPTLPKRLDEGCNRMAAYRADL